MRSIRNFSLTLSLLLVCVAGWSSPVDATLARFVARQFLGERPLSLARGTDVSAHELQTVLERSHVMAFSSPSDGFIVVGGYGSEALVLGYTDHALPSADALPATMLSWLDGCERMLTALEADDVALNGGAPTHDPIAPLIPVHWNQQAPYNNACPEGCVTGCVSVAMGQVMYYHRWPADEFKWDLMLPSYLSDYSDESAAAVAELLYSCGKSVQTKYDTVESQANSALIPDALINNYGYDSHTRLEEFQRYNAVGWDNLVYTELLQKRPVLYCGVNPAGQGHQFLVDGCDDKGFYHVNWGWGSLADGYYRLMEMNPTYNGIGGSTKSLDGYVMNFSAVVGIQPPADIVDENENRLTVTKLQILGDERQFNRLSPSQDFENVPISYEVFNFLHHDQDIFIGLALVADDNTIASMIFEAYGGVSLHNYFYSGAYLVTFGAGVPSGHYRLLCLCREPDAEQWSADLESDRCYIDVYISDTQMLVSPHPQPLLAVTAIDYGGDWAPYSKQTIHAVVTNTGDDFSGHLFFLVNGNYSSAAGTAIDRGQKAQVTFHYVPLSEGTDSLVIALDTDGKNPIFQDQITVSGIQGVVADKEAAGPAYTLGGVRINATADRQRRQLRVVKGRKMF